jgi:hypothetical protein
LADLVLRDAATATMLLTGQEAAEQRNVELEAEVRRLRDQLGE